VVAATTKRKSPGPSLKLQLKQFVGQRYQYLLYIVVSCYDRFTVTPQAAIVVVAYFGMTLPIDVGLRLESQNGSPFHTIGIVAPQYTKNTIAPCGMTLCL
jgi:hypothetical protein